VKESRKIATFYQGKNVAEKNTVDLTWDLLQDNSFKVLQTATFPQTWRMPGSNS
jgi:hypothetical protein